MAEIRNHAILVTTEGQASWNAPFAMKAQAPKRLAAWKRLPVVHQPMETARNAPSIATAPVQPAYSHSTSMIILSGMAAPCRHRCRSHRRRKMNTAFALEPHGNH